MAYRDRTSFPCSNLSFEAIAEGSLPLISVNIVDQSTKEISWKDSEDVNEQEQVDHRPMIEMVVCSFALHLIENPSGIFALLWQLSLKARWLVILAPHKKPEV